MPTSKFQAAKSEIRTRIEGLERDILKQVELSNLLEQEREQWGLAKSMNGPTFASYRLRRSSNAVAFRMAGVRPQCPFKSILKMRVT